MNMTLETVDLSLPTYEDAINNDALPHYTCNTKLNGNLLLKQELESPNQVANQRCWRKVHGEIRGTLLILSPITKTGAPTVIRSYTLQAADVGIAVDYARRSNVFRLRVEGEQLLLATLSLPHMLIWIEKLNAAIAISLDLDEREVPFYRTIPKGRSPSFPGLPFVGGDRRECRTASEFRLLDLSLSRRRESCWLAQTRAVLNEQTLCFMPTCDSRPFLAEGNNERVQCSSEHCRRSGDNDLRTFSGLAHWSRVFSTDVENQLWNRLRVKLSSGESQANISKESVQPDQKWHPEAASFDFDDHLQYARRCVRHLRYCSGWKDGLYIKQGQVFVIPERMTAAYWSTKYQKWAW